MKKEYPVYSIEEFKSDYKDKDFYANYVNTHVKGHHFTKLPHKHDFYLIILFTVGSGTHEIDFESYKVSPGTLFILKPGEMHYWDLSDDIDGYVFFHSKEFYDQRYVTSSVKDFEFYSSFQNASMVMIEGNTFSIIKNLMRELVEESHTMEILKWEKTHALITLIYINISRVYQPTYKIDSAIYLRKVRQFEDLIEANFKNLKFSKEYAAKLSISEKHLNRITKECLNKTSTELISERLLLEAKRLLMQSERNVNEISDYLGFNDSSYFIRFFKKHTSVTPMNFLKTYLLR